MEDLSRLCALDPLSDLLRDRVTERAGRTRALRIEVRSNRVAVSEVSQRAAHHESASVIGLRVTRSPMGELRPRGVLLDALGADPNVVSQQVRPADADRTRDPVDRPVP